ncbi:L-histidine N(alpha)-methyltransferase [Flavobacteriaceae bacterium F89]|uniref:L-histidine N(Alpha)-methyltransferase n=1 Tax=Cerina litoralis TaxID=2874477 RepID=A0AAE3EUW8_9FLAO|nr:L-histidine N(alpha)-methyltransferase [Cerina litoralis]MCG2460584.1 L-histidine N(alpha)-methyltransferase [Cerina litoralis]
MDVHTNLAFETLFGEEVYDGLTHNPKRLSSKFFYDKKGDFLFQRIMAMPEYYLTNCELEIFEKHKSEITDWFVAGTDQFNLIELGAGDGKKTKILLRHLFERKAKFNYFPVDISENILEQLKASLQEELPRVSVNPIRGTYFEALKGLERYNGTPNVILFLGSNIGNLKHRQAIDFLRKLKENMNGNDLLFIGFDQKKNPRTVLNAYNDATGITEAFNKNILARINGELEGNFDLDKFLHWEVYDPETGTAKSFLVSKVAQSARIDKLDLEVHFKQWETIHTETSQKYDDNMVRWLTEEAELEIKAQFTDSNYWYKDYLLGRK